MKYFIDFEFLEGDIPCQIKGFSIPRWLIKPSNTIQPISVGICSSDGREYYAISKDFNLKEAWNRYDIKQEWYSIDESTQSTRDIKVYWIRENVLKPIFYELHLKDLNISYKAKDILQNQIDKLFTYNNLRTLINKYGKTNKQIAQEIIEFTNEIVITPSNRIPEVGVNPQNITICSSPIKFYGYYCDYDWVVFCWLFGKMIDLPEGFPMYCIDLKQILDEQEDIRVNTPGRVCGLKGHPNYPKQTNEHDALADARWNYELYKFLKTL